MKLTFLRMQMYHFMQTSPNWLAVLGLLRSNSNVLSHMKTTNEASHESQGRLMGRAEIAFNMTPMQFKRLVFPKSYETESQE